MFLAVLFPVGHAGQALPLGITVTLHHLATLCKGHETISTLASRKDERCALGSPQFPILIQPASHTLIIHETWPGRPRVGD